MKPLAGVRLPSETRLAAGAVIATIMMVVSAGCGGGSDDGNIVARSDLGEVTRADLDTYILRLEADDRRPPEGTSLEAWRLGLLEKLLVEEALLADFDDQRDPMVEAARREVLMEAVEEIFVAPRTAISEEDLRRYYDEHPEEFGHPEQIRLRHIFKRVSRDATPEERDRVRQEMEALLNDIRSGASFGDLAREQSQSETAPLNGLIGRLSRGSLHPSVEKVVWGLNEGEVSDVVPTAVGFHIFLLENHLEPYKMEFEEAGGRLVRKLQLRARAQVLADMLVELLAESGAVYRPELLEADPPPDPQEVLFSLGGTLITVASVDAYLNDSTVYQQRVTPPSQWLEGAIRRALFVWKAEQEQLADRPEVAARLAAITRQTIAAAGWRKRIAAELESLDAEGVLEEFYFSSAARLQTPKLFHLRIILKEIAGLDRPYDSYEVMDRLRDEIVAGQREFEEAARDFSDDISARDGGDLRWVHLKYFGEWAGLRVQRAVRALEPGEVSEPLLAEFYDQALLKYRREGYLLVKLEGTREPELRPYEQIKNQVAQLFETTNRRQLEERIKGEIFESIDAEILLDRP